MHDKWDEFCRVTITGRTALYGKFNIGGVDVCFFHTKYGDGGYFDNEGRVYSVDAGLIGCILVDDISEDEIQKISDGNVIEFHTDFECHGDRDTGDIYFGDVLIRTGDIFDDEEEEEDEW